MSSRDDEIRRLERLRKEQLDARDPTARQRSRNANMTQHYRKSRKRITVGSILKDFEAKWLLMFIGFSVGLIIVFIINVVAEGESWAAAVGWGCVLFFTVAGRVMGSILDWGNDDWTPKR